MAWYCISFGLIARYHTVMYRCYSAPANYRVVHLVIFRFLYLLSHMKAYFVKENKVFDCAMASGQLGGSGETAAASAADAG